MVIAISVAQVSKGNKQTRPEPKLPKYHCSSCTKCKNKYCDCFQRRIEPDYNMCFYHSTYNPIIVVFKPPSNLKEIMQREEELYGEQIFNSTNQKRKRCS